MKTMKLLLPAIALLGLLTAACGDDDDRRVPDTAITLNMLNEEHGKTLLGGSDVYINRADNFTTTECGIVDFGDRGGFDSNPNLTQVAQEVAVTPGSYYQVLPAQDIREVAGERAFPVHTGYYNLYVDTPLYDKDGDLTGAKVIYAECFPATSRLPEWDTDIDICLRSGNDGETAAYTFDKGARIDEDFTIRYVSGADLYETLEIRIDGNKIIFTNHAWTPGGEAAVIAYVRHGSLFTRVRFLVKSPN